MSLPFNHIGRYGKILITVSQNKICQKNRLVSATANH